MQIKKYSGATAEPKENETVFFIQSHGMNSGRPLKNPICNCWEVRTERSFDFEILAIVFESKILETFITGSVIPFIPLGDYKKVIAPILQNAVHENEKINKKYFAIRKIDAGIEHQKKMIKSLQELKIAISHETFKFLKTKTIEKTY